MPAPQGYVALDLVGFTDKGDYAAGTTYAQNDLVHSDNRIYLSLQDNNVGQALPVSPDTETEFWKLWLSGGGDDLEALTAEDTSNVTGGGAGQVVVAQTLIDAIANKVMNDLVAKSQIINNLLATQAGNVLDATQGKALKDEIDQLNSDLQNRYSLLIPETLIPNNSDLNDYTTPGQYYVSTAANSKTIENCPYTLSGFKLTVEKTSSDGHILQTLKAVNAKYIYYRTAADSNFNDWLTPVTNADLPLSAKTYQLGGNQELSFSYAGGNASCLIFAVRDSNAGIYFCDNWNYVVTAKDFANLNVSVSNKTVTIQNNNASFAINVIVLIANNIPVIQA